MLKYLVASVAAIYSVLLIFGDESRRPDVTRQAQDDVTGFSLAAFALPETSAVTRTLDSDISEAQAVQLAIEAGKAHRANRTAAPLRGLVTAVETVAATETAAPSGTGGYWYVTGSRVNLRAGPGTGNAVVGQLVSGDATEVLDDQNGWYQVRTADGAISGWVSARFLSDRQPG